MANFVEKATLKLVDETSGNAKKINKELKALFATAKSFKSSSKAIDIRINSNEVRNKIKGISGALAALSAKRVTLNVDSSQVKSALSLTNKLNRATAKSPKVADPAIVAARAKAIGTTARAKATAVRSAGPAIATAQSNVINAKAAAAATIAGARAAAAIQAASAKAAAAATVASAKAAAATQSANAVAIGKAQAAATVAQARAAAIASRAANAPLPSAARLARPSGGRRAGANGNPAIAGVRGLAQGSGIAGLSTSLSSFDASLVAITSAAYIAAKALRSVGENAASRDRSKLQLQAVSSKEQRDIINAGNKKPAGAGPIGFSQDERSQLAASLLGDVQGDAKERATAAMSITKSLEKDFVPRFFAANPGKSREQNLEGLREIIKAANIGSSDLTDAKTGELSADGKRVVDAIALAKAVDPELNNRLIKSTMANLKTSAFQLDTTALAQVLVNAGNDGVRVANEAFRSQKSLTGTTDNKTLNNALADPNGLNLLKNAKRNDKNNVIAGTGTIKDEALLGADPSAWLLQNIAPTAQKNADAVAKKQGRKSNQNDMVQAITRLLPGMSAAAINGITKMIIGASQNKVAIEQGNLALQQPVDESLKSSWVAQAEAVGVAWKDAAAKVGDSFMTAVGADKVLKGVADILTGEREVTPKEAAAGVLGGAVLGKAALGLGSVIMKSLNPLTGSATALNVSAGLLDGAATALTTAATAGKVATAAATVLPTAGAAAATVGGLTVGGIVAAGAAILAAGAGFAALSYEARKFNESIKDTPRNEAHNRGNKAARAARQALIDGRDEEVRRNQPRDDATKAADIGKALFEQFMVKANAESVVKKAEAALKENEAKEQTPEVKAEGVLLKNTIEALTARLGEMQLAMKEAQAEKNALTPKTSGDVFDKGAAPVPGLDSSMKVDQFMQIGTIIDASMVKGKDIVSAGLDSGFSQGATKIIEAGNGMGSAILDLAPSIGNAIGSAAGSAITAAVQNISINVKSTTGGANTGKSNPVE
jgi:hypothetical protein